MKPQNKSCTAVREGSSEYLCKLSGKKSALFERSKVKECGLSPPLLDEAIQYTT